MKRIFLLLILSVFSLSALAQDFTEEEGNLIRQAYEYSDSGREDEAIAIYDGLIKKHPDISGLKFEKAYCLYKKEEYKAAYKILKATLSAKDVKPEFFAVAGNCQDMMGQPDKALKTYREGLKRFPESGYLHLETGNVLIAHNHTQEGIECYEQGIKADPTFASNYYRAAQFLIDDQPVKGIIYAEMHNLLYDPNGPRWAEISKALYDAYNANIHFEADTVRTTFSRDRNIFIDINAINRPEALLKALMPAAQEVEFSDAMEASIDAEALKAAGGQLTLAELSAIRRRFLEYFDADEQEKYPVFAFQKHILDGGHWEAYNMWMLREGRPEEYSAWLQDNGPALEALFKFISASE